jgi:hypothetical protein
MHLIGPTAKRSRVLHRGSITRVADSRRRDCAIRGRCGAPAGGPALVPAPAMRVDMVLAAG